MNTISISARRRYLAVAATAAALLGPPALAQTGVVGVTVQNGPSQAVQAWSRAAGSGDVAAIARIHGPEAVGRHPGVRLHTPCGV